MPSIAETYAGRSGSIGDNSFEELTYRAIDYDNTADVYAAVLAEAPETFNDLPRRSISAAQYSEHEECWKVTVSYTQARPTVQAQPSNTVAYSFNYQMRGQQIYRSLETAFKEDRVRPGEAPDFGGLINVTFDHSNGKPEGLQLEPPDETHSLEFTGPSVFVNAAYQDIVEQMCGRMNDAPFRGADTGELVLVRVQGGVRSGEDWSISFGFARRVNEFAKTIVPGLIVPFKRGHDLVWTWNQPKFEATSAGLLVTAYPRAVYVERVFEFGNFDLLGLPI